MRLEDFKKKWGTHTPKLLIQRLIDNPLASPVYEEQAQELADDLLKMLEHVSE